LKREFHQSNTGFAYRSKAEFSTAGYRNLTSKKLTFRQFESKESEKGEHQCAEHGSKTRCPVKRFSRTCIKTFNVEIFCKQNSGRMLKFL
jgi:hypothetical protein